MGKGGGDGTGEGTRDDSVPDAAAGRLSRRSLLRLAGAAGLGLGVLGEVVPVRAEDLNPVPQDIVPFYGDYQAGISTPQQGHLISAAFDVTVDKRSELRDLLHLWSTVAARLSVGKQVGSHNNRPTAPTQDTGEARELHPANLSVTIGFGGSLFDKDGVDRFGIRHHRPAALAPIPAMPHEALDPSRSHGDLCLQVCGDDPQVVFHAIHNLRRMAHGAATLRWMQEGFLPGTGANLSGATARNVMGFKDGTNNLQTSDSSLMNRYVWVGAGDGPNWMASGTYMVTRRIRIHLDKWDDSKLAEQESTFGRHKASGAPLGASNEFTSLDLAARGANGKLLIPSDAHVRLAHEGSERILRRGYSYCDGREPTTGAFEAGLFFVGFQRDPRTQFVPLQQRLAAHDALNEYITHVAGALFACPPGASQGEYVGETLFGTV